MGKGASIAACFGDDALGVGAGNPLFRGQGKAIQPSLHFKPVEFDGIKNGVVDPFSYSQ